MNQSFSCLEKCFNRGSERAPSHSEEKGNPCILEDAFSSKTGPSMFTAIASQLLKWSNKTVEFFQH